MNDIHYTYDKKGQIIKGESAVRGYYTENIYTPNGDFESWTMNEGGIPVVSGHYIYDNHYKSLLRGGTPGIMVYDEFSTASVFYDHDPDQTQWHTAHNGNLEFVDYVKKLG